MEILERDTLYICGYSVETALAQSDKDVSALYNDFFSSGKDFALCALHGVKQGYYGLMWYTQGHEKYCYLLGLEVGADNTAPKEAVLKKIPKTTYAMAKFPQNKDIIQAWTEFFYTEIPNAGLSPNEVQNFYFEYYPVDGHGDYELWVPVVKADV